MLAAAREEFATHDFQAATMRSIAARAGVDVALLAHYFGNKEGLFAATIELPPEASALFVGVFTAEPLAQGERLTRDYLGLYEDSASGTQMKALARAAVSSATATAAASRLLSDVASAPEVAAALEGRRAGFALAMSHLAGIAFNRYINEVPFLADLDFEQLVACVAPATQHYLSLADQATPAMTSTEEEPARERER